MIQNSSAFILLISFSRTTLSFDIPILFYYNNFTYFNKLHLKIQKVYSSKELNLPYIIHNYQQFYSLLNLLKYIN